MGGGSLEEKARDVLSFEAVSDSGSLPHAGEEKYRALLDAIEHGLAIAEVSLGERGDGADCQIIEANQQFAQLLGKSGEEDLIGKSVWELFPTLQVAGSGTLGRVADTGEPVRLENYVSSLDRWFEIYGFRIGEATQRRVALVSTDISSRHRAEQAVRTNEKIQAYLLKLSDVLRPIANPTEIMTAAPEVLACELAVSTAGYVEMSEDGDSIVMGGQYADGRMPELKGPCRFSEFGEGFGPALATGEEIFISDVYEDSRGPAGGSDKARSFKIRSGAGIPLMKKDRMVAFFYATHFETRTWEGWEREIVRQTAERTWAAVERARAESAQRESEEKYRALFDSIDQGFAVVEVLYDENGVATDVRFVEGNRVFEKQTGLTDYRGKTRRQLVTYLEDYWAETYARVAETGEPVRFENYSKGLGRWFSVFASRQGGPGSRFVNVVFDDITERKKTEKALRSSEERQAYKWKLSDALRPLSDPIEIQGTASQILGERLRANRVFYGEIDEELGGLLIDRDFVRPGTPSAAGQHSMEILTWLRSSPQKFEPTVVRDVQASEVLPEADRAGLAGVQAGAFIAVPLIKDGRLVACLCAMDSVARDWTEEEVEQVWHTGERTWAAVERARAIAAVGASEEKYRTLFDSIDNAIAVLEVLFDNTGKAVNLRFIDTNDVFGKLTGLKNHLGRTTGELLPQLADSCIDEYASVVKTGETARFESYSHDFGRWINISASRVGGEGSHLVNVIFDDISERKHAEASLRTSEERQAYLLKLSDALRPLLDPIEIQGTASRLLAEHLNADRAFYSKMDEARGQLVVEQDYVRDGTPSLVGRYPLEAWAWIEETTQKGEPAIIDNVVTSPLIPDADRAVILGTGVSAFICVPMLKDDRKLSALCAAHMEPRAWTETEIALVRDTADRTWAAVDRTKAEAALRESEERFRLFLENVHEYALVQLDEEMRIASWNPGAERIFGYSSNEVVGQPFSLLLSPEDRVVGVPCLATIDEEKGGRTEDARWLIHKNGRRIWTRWVTEPIRDNEGRVTGFTKVLRDETERLRAETSLRQSEKLAVVGRMASSIAHEINNPLEAVTNLIYLARTSEIPSGVTDLLLQAERELARVSHIATATLHFHRHTSEPAEVDVEEILESVLLLHEGRLKATQITTERRYSSHPTVSCLANEIRQVFANLVGNAVDAMYKNTGRRRLIVRVRKAVDSKSGETGVRVMIADTGSGIPESAKKHVFEPFFTTKTATGTGLGLWISAETMKKHEGTLRFRSRTAGPHRGTLFSVFLAKCIRE
jgi:PAS domain S-box-containing protein